MRDVKTVFSQPAQFLAGMTLNFAFADTKENPGLRANSPKLSCE